MEIAENAAFSSEEAIICSEWWKGVFILVYVISECPKGTITIGTRQDPISHELVKLLFGFGIFFVLFDSCLTVCLVCDHSTPCIVPIQLSINSANLSDIVSSICQPLATHGRVGFMLYKYKIGLVS